MRFEWDAENIAHVAAHGLSTDDVEAVVIAADFTARAVSALRFVGHGTVGGKRFRVVAAFVGENTIRVITAFQISRRRK